MRFGLTKVVAAAACVALLASVSGCGPTKAQSQEISAVQAAAGRAEEAANKAAAAAASAAEAAKRAEAAAGKAEAQFKKSVYK